MLLTLILIGLVPLTQATFFGPVAVGFGVGLVSVRRKFPVATSIVSRRSSRQYSLSTFYQSTPYGSFGYSTRTYSRTEHYFTPHHRAYYQPNIYHYHSTPWGPRLVPGRKKRAAEKARVRREARGLDIDDVSVNSISDVAANVTAGFHDTIWYNDMSFKDRDDCSKRLLCELNARIASGQELEEDEVLIADSFGREDAVDVGEETMDFDIAAIVGKQIGLYMCERRYRRCETPVDTMLLMIKTEMEEMKVVEEDIATGTSTLQDIENALFEEKEEIEEIRDFELFQTTTTTTTTTTRPTTTTAVYYPQVQVWGGSISQK